MRIDWNSHDRLIIALFAASVVHAVLLLGVSLPLPKPLPTEKSLDIVLVNRPSPQAPLQADYLAPQAQVGSGAADAALAAAETPPLPDNADDTAQPAPVNAPTQADAQPQPPLTQPQAEQTVPLDAPADDLAPAAEPAYSAASISQIIADFSTDAQQADSHAPQPKLTHIDSVSAQFHPAAAYKAAWGKTVERVGDLINYPAAVRKHKPSASLTLSVGINPDGSVYAIKVHESSGEPALDETAKRIVQMAAPYPPLPAELRQDGHVLVITRKWQFSVRHN